MRKPAHLAVGLAVLALGAGACGGDDEEPATPAATTGAPDTQTHTQTETQTQTSATAAPSGGGQSVKVSGTDFKFNPANFTVRSGEVTFDFSNDGQAPHALEVEGQGLEEETATLNAGQSERLRVNLRPGRYTIYCPVGNHRELGMEGTVTVR